MNHPNMRYYVACVLILLGDRSRQYNVRTGFAVAFTSPVFNALNNPSLNGKRASNNVQYEKIRNRKAEPLTSFYVSKSVDEYLESLSIPNNNNNNNNSGNDNKGGAQQQQQQPTYIEIHTDSVEQLPLETTTPMISSSLKQTRNSQGQKANSVTVRDNKVEYEFFTGKSRKRGSIKKNKAKHKMMDSSLKLYRNANKGLRNSSSSSSARLSREQETDLAYAIQDLKTAIKVRDGLNDPLEDQWAAACNLTVRQLRRVMIWGREARTQLVAANAGLVTSIAKKYSGDLRRATQYSGGIGTILTLQDMIQEGNLGLMEAAERFEPSRGFRFSTYASYWVKQRILRAIADHSRVIRLPVHVHSILRTIQKTRKDMEKENGDLPSIDELANRLDMSVDKLKRYTDSSQMVLSLEVPFKSQNSGEDKRTLGDRIASDSPTPEEDAEFDSLREDIRFVMDSLGQREKDVLTLRFGLDDGTPKTVEETSRGLGISRDRVRNVEARALNKLRHPQRNYKLKEYVGEQSDEKEKIEDLSPEEIWSF